VVTTAAKSDGAGGLDIVIASAIALGCISAAQKMFPAALGQGSAVSMTYGVVSILAVSNAATLLISSVTNASVVDSVSVVVSTLLLGKVAGHVASVWTLN
jgi:hypothetical protein